MDQIVRRGSGAISYRVRHADGRYRRWHEEVRWLPPVGNRSAQWVGCAVQHSGRALTARLALMARARLDGFIHGCLTTPTGVVAVPMVSPPAQPRAQEALLDYALREANDGLWDWDLTTDEVYYSPRWKALLGYADHELPNHLSTWEKLTDPDDRERALQAASRYVAGLESRFHVEFRMRHKNGHWVEVLARASLIRDANGRPWRLVGTHLDITDRKTAEVQLREANVRLQQRAEHADAKSQSALEALQQSEERLRLAMMAANQGFYDLNVQTGDCVVSPEYARMLGYEPEEFVETNAAWIERLHPEDREPVARNYREYVAGLRPVYAVEFRQRTRTGDWKWILSLGRIVAHSPDGQPLRMLGTHTDITRRKLAELERDEQGHLLRNVIDSCSDMLFLKDCSLRTILCNRAFASALGRPPEEVCGKTDLENGWPPELVPGFEAEDRAVLRGETVRNPCDVVSIAGELRSFDTIKVPFRDPAGVIVGVLGMARDITARRAVEDALRQSEAKVRKLIETMRDGFVSVDMAGRIVECNPAYEAMLGYSLSELQQRTYIDLTPEKWREFEVGLVREQILPRGYSDIYEKEYRRSDGRVFPIELQSVLITDEQGQPAGIWAVVRDITIRKRAEEQLKKLNETLEQQVIQRTESLHRSEERFRTLAGATFEGVLLSRHGVVLDCNEQFARILACRRESIIGRKVADFIVPEWRERVMARIVAGDESRFEYEVVRADGSRRIVEAHGRSPDGPKGIRITVMRDTTERRRAEAELAAQRQELLRFQRLAELSEISAGVLHQIGQPLTAVMNNVTAAKSMLSQCSNPECAALDALLDSDACLRNVRATMDRLRALTHPERAVREARNLNAVVLDAVKLIREEAQGERINLTTALEPALPPVPLDDIQIGQALINILRNACQAVAECEPARREVTIITRPDGPEAVVIEISDRGGGIVPGAEGEIFEPFFTTKADGMGVGLSLCRTIIKAHGGTITACNRAGEPGATFRITLPVTRGGRS